MMFVYNLLTFITIASITCADAFLNKYLNQPFISSPPSIFRIFYRRNKSSDKEKSEKINLLVSGNESKNAVNVKINQARKIEKDNVIYPSWKECHTGLFIDKLRQLSFRDIDQVQDRNRIMNYIIEEDRIVSDGSLSALLHLHVPQMTPSMIASLTNSIGLLNQKQILKKISSADYNYIVKVSCDVIDDLKAEDVALVLSGFSRLRVQTFEILKNEPNFITKITHHVSYMSTRQLGDVLWSLASIGFQWSGFHQTLRFSLLNTFETLYAENDFDNFTLSSILWSFAKLGTKWKDLSRSVRKRLIDHLSSVSDDLSPQQASKVIWSLGTLGCSYYQDLSPEFFDTFISRINMIKRSQVGNAVAAGQTLTGFAKIGVPWNLLSKVSKSGLWEQLMRVSMSPNGKALSNAVWALGTIQATHSDIPSAVCDSMMDGIRKVLNECSSWTMCNMIWGLARMGFRWNDFDANVQESITMNIGRICSKMNDIDIGILLWSMGELDAPLDRFPDYVLEGIYDAILRSINMMRSPEIARALWGISLSGISWDRLPTAVKWNLNSSLRRVALSMSPQDLANSAYAFAILAYDSEDTFDPIFRGIHETLLDTVQRSSRKLTSSNELSFQCDSEDNSSTITSNERAAKGSVGVEVKEFEQLRIFANYLVALQRVSDTSRIPQHLLGPAVVPSRGISSNLQKIIVRELKDSLFRMFEESERSHHNFTVVTEFSSFKGVFPVDAAILRGGVLIALLEVDGPHHYRYDGRLSRKDGMKEAMYRSMHPHILFRRVRWDEIQSIGVEAIADELASSIARHSIGVTPWTTAWQNMQQKCSAFFSWSLRRTN